MKFHRQLVWERLQIERERMDMEKTKAWEQMEHEKAKAYESIWDWEIERWGSRGTPRSRGSCLPTLASRITEVWLTNQKEINERRKATWFIYVLAMYELCFFIYRGSFWLLLNCCVLYWWNGLCAWYAWIWGFENGGRRCPNWQIGFGRLLSTDANACNKLWVEENRSSGTPCVCWQLCDDLP